MSTKDIPDFAAPHYVDNKALLAAIIEYKAKCKEQMELGKPVPRIPEYIGSCLLKISTRYSLSARQNKNFIGYSFREDMVMDGVETCVRYFHNFDPAKSSNPFSYFTQICYYSFLNRIAKEKKQLYTRFKAIQNQRTVGIMAGSQEHEELQEFGLEIQENNDYMNDYISNFETSTEKKKKELIERKATLNYIPLDELFVDSDIDAVE